MTFPLSGTSALVTGATSGIGRATAMSLAQLGARVVLSGRDEVRGEQVVKDIRAAGGQAHFVRADLHDEASARALAARAKERVGPIDVLVNSAGIYPFGPTSTEGTAGMGEDLNALAGAAPAPPPPGNRGLHRVPGQPAIESAEGDPLDEPRARDWSSTRLSARAYWSDR